MYKTSLKIDGMYCSMCESHVNDMIRNNIHINKIKSNHKTGICEIISDNEITKDELDKALKDSGYDIIDYQYEEYKKKGLFNF